MHVYSPNSTGWLFSDCLFCYKIENSFSLKNTATFFSEIWERRYSSTKIEGHDLQDIKLMISCFRSKIYLPNRGLIRKQSQENHVMNQNSFSDLKQKRMKVKKWYISTKELNVFNLKVFLLIQILDKPNPIELSILLPFL